MALRLRIKHPDFFQEEISNLTANVAAGATTLTVASNNGFSQNDIIVVALPGKEQSEMVKVSSVSGNNTITLSTGTRFAHGEGSTIYRSLYDQLSVERKPISGAYAEIDEGKIAIDVDSDDGHTIVSIAAGISTDTFKWRFYNSASGSFSSYSDELSGTGAPRNSVAYMLTEFRQTARIPDHKKVTDEQIIRWFNDGQDRVETNGDRWWFLLTENTSKVTIPSTFKYALPSDFARMEALLYDDGDIKIRLNNIPLSTFDQLKITQSTAPDDDTIRDWAFLPPDSDNLKGYFGVDPTPATAGLVFTIRHYREMPDLDTFGDTTLIPLPEVLVNFALFSFWKSRGQETTAQYYYQLYLQGIEMLKKLQRREVSQAGFVKWRGHRGKAKEYGNRVGFYSDTIRENYW